MTNEQKAMIDSLRSQGHGYKKVSAMTGISLNTVKSYFRRTAVPTELMPGAAMILPAVPAETESEHRCKCCGKKVKQTDGRKEKSSALMPAASPGGTTIWIRCSAKPSIILFAPPVAGNSAPMETPTGSTVLMRATSQTGLEVRDENDAGAVQKRTSL